VGDPESLVPDAAVSVNAAGDLPHARREREGDREGRHRTDGGGRSRQPKEREERHNLPEFTHEYLREHIKFADEKAAVVFAAVAALLAYLKADGAFDVLHRWPEKWGWHDWAGVVASVLLALASIFALWVVKPRGGGGVLGALRDTGRGVLRALGLGRRADATEPSGVIYWEEIRGHADADAYAARVEALTQRAARREVLGHNYVLAGINRGKYAALAWAIRTAGAGFVATIFYLFTSKALPTPAPTPPASAPTTTPSPSTPPVNRPTPGGAAVSAVPVPSSMSPRPSSGARDSLARHDTGAARRATPQRAPQPGRDTARPPKG
jgi:hypothetical protein